MTVEEFAVVKMSYASNPWRIVHVPSGRTISIPKALTNGDGQEVRFRGSACFPRKRDALQWIRDELPGLLAETNPERSPSPRVVKVSDTSQHFGRVETPELHQGARTE